VLGYLASPFTHEDKHVQATRAEQVAEAAAYLMQAGLFVFAPVPHGAAIAKYGLPDGYDEFWKPYCHATLGRCDILIVLMLDGWKTSTGVQDEIAFAHQKNMPIYYLDFDGEAAIKDFAEMIVGGGI